MENMSNCNLNGDINVKIDNSDSKENVKDELLKQLHEQYAINNNANLSTIVTLIVAVIAVIGYFGYVYIHTGLKFSNDFGNLLKDSDTYYLDALLLVYLASVFVISILIRLCVYQGVAQRKEQFIIHAIRYKNFTQTNFVKSGDTQNINTSSEENDKNTSDFWDDDNIFHNNYHPFGKKCLNVVQGLYGEFVKILLLLFVFLTTLLLLKIIIIEDIHSLSQFGKLFDNNCFLYISICIIILVISFCCRIYNSFYEYKRIEKLYKDYKPKSCKHKCCLVNILLKCFCWPCNFINKLIQK